MVYNNIRFIDSDYRDLFCIPDGGEITIQHSYDGKMTKYQCKYIDDTHFELMSENNSYGNVYHICQFAEIMERNGDVYKPVIHGEYKLETPAPEEAEFAASRHDAGSLCAFAVNFTHGNRMFIDGARKNGSFDTDEFNKEFLDVFNYFRVQSETPILKNPAAIDEVCDTVDSITKDSHDNKTNIFKVQTEKHTYYLSCLRTGHNFSEHYVHIYCYDTAELNRYKDVKFVEQTYGSIEADKFFRIDGGFIEEYYNPDATAGGQLVYVNISDDVIKEAAESKENMKDVNLFFSHLAAYGRETLLDAGDMGFRGEVDDFMNAKADFEGCTKKSMNGILKAAGVKIKDKDMER